MNEIEQALGRLKKALDQLKDKLDNNMSASFLDDSDHSASVDVDTQAIDLVELKSIKSQISDAITLMEQLTSEMDEATNNILVESKKDRQ